jgi:O-antigen/teichoic acid export membrane protein
MSSNASVPEPNNLTKRVGLLALAKFIAFAMAFLLPVLLVRLLTVSDFGLYKQAFLILSTALTLLNLQVAWTAYYFMPREPEQRLQIALNIILFYFLIGLAVLIFFLIYPQWVLIIFKSDALIPYLPWLGLAILLWLVSSNLETFQIANKDIANASKYIVISQLSKTSLLIVAGLLFQSVQAIVIAAVVQGLFQTLIMAWYLKKSLGHLSSSYNGRLFRLQLMNALPFGIGTLVWVLRTDMHNYFVSHHFDAVGFAIYSVGCFQLPLLGLLEDSINSVLVPEVSRLEKDGNYEQIADLWTNAVRKMAIFFFPLAALLFSVRHEFILFLFTDAYLAAVPVFAVNLIGILFAIHVASIIRAFEDFRFFRLKLNLVLTPLMALFLYLGIKYLGLIGAILAVVSIQLVDVVITVIMVSRKLGLSFYDMRRFEPVLRTLTCCVLALLVTSLIRSAFEGARPFTVLVICSISFSIVYVTTSFFAGVITIEEKGQLLNALSKTKRVILSRA